MRRNIRTKDAVAKPKAKEPLFLFLLLHLLPFDPCFCAAPLLLRCGQKGKRATSKGSFASFASLAFVRLRAKVADAKPKAQVELQAKVHFANAKVKIRTKLTFALSSSFAFGLATATFALPGQSLCCCFYYASNLCSYFC